ncbi:MAG: leucyl aminopeptidase [Pseudomonadales bacterium]|nr:leucyl aminopeptidase [Pseudomonadales bacterium]
MNFTVKTINTSTLKSACILIPVFEGGRLSASGKVINKSSKGFIARVLKSGDLTGKTGQTLLLHNVPGTLADRILLTGFGEQKEITPSNYKKALISGINALKSTESKDASLCVAEIKVKGQNSSANIKQAALEIESALYTFDQYKSKEKTTNLKKVTFVLTSPATTENNQAAKNGKAVGVGVNLAKDLGNSPPNVCHPSYLAKQAQQLAKSYSNLSVKIINEKELEKMGAGAFLSVSQGSDQPAKLIVMQYKGGKPGDAPHALVGKGITFDSGGISLKPGAGMDEMKYDMGGAASVFGTVKAICELKLKLNVVAVVAAAENMPSGGASRPGDIVTTMSGQTVEILNTDAEGRLVLCDALTYVGQFKPASVVDIATLTGACIIALGHQTTAMLSNNETVAKNLLAAGNTALDKAWQLPLEEEYQSQLDSPFADMANIGGRPAGTITAACFLSRFAEDYQWAHLDIAGTAWVSGGMKKGSTGRPVPLLTQYLQDRANEKASAPKQSRAAKSKK